MNPLGYEQPVYILFVASLCPSIPKFVVSLGISRPDYTFLMNICLINRPQSSTKLLQTTPYSVYFVLKHNNYITIFSFASL